MPAPFRIAIVGAASLRGKELNEALGESAFSAAEFFLMDDQEAIGQLEAVGDEVTFVQEITPTSFDRIDFTFFTGSPELTRKHWETAARAGSSIIDLSGALDQETGAVICAPWVQSNSSSGEGTSGGAIPALDLHTAAMLPAHPAALTLALLLGRLQRAGAIRSAFATVLEPASEYGRAAMDELHQQTVNLLSFQPLPKEMYDAQVAFNLTPVSGEEGKLRLQESEARIRAHYAALAEGSLPRLPIQLIHAPVFHGYNFSIGVEFLEPVDTKDVLAALSGEHVEVMQTDADAPSNLAVAGQEEVLVRVRPAVAGAAGGPAGGASSATEDVAPNSLFWIWAAADNLKLTALNAVACALELRRLRPQGQVQ